MRRLLPLLLVLAACEERPPVNRSQARAIAEQHNSYQGREWGVAREAVRLASADQDGRTWFQVVFDPGPAGEARTVWVNRRSRWARITPPPGLETAPARPAPVARSAAEPPLPAAGSWLLVCTEPNPGPERLTELNRAARAAGLPPWFVRRPVAGGQLVFGWHDDTGLARDQALAERVAAIAPLAEAPWRDLDPQTAPLAP